ncbi:hypothetical protein BofuT4_uP002340.1 [Botrytis cinerea T4]|uniref:Uncharacterized protein n=1 Tax=Botryotinia fuckeliana (strain T4) TaxID=999810 RepID=G2YMD9_BOTF4|nr:hypothetical protein BofuT4_uP002340.1 [Botrytis cinerea T4]
MPSNYSTVPPQEVTGTTQLPLSRIKKIIGTDQDINMCSNNAAFVITLATLSIHIRKCSFNTWPNQATMLSSLNANLVETFNTVIFVSTLSL